jgi:hypothetical protein
LLALGLTVALTVSASGGPPRAEAAIDAYENSEQAAHFGEIRSGKCRVRRTNSGKTFHATGKTTNRAYKLNIDIYDFRGFDREYNVEYGGASPAVDFEGVFNEDDFSNSYPFPGTPPNSAGAVAFQPDGRRVGIGVYALPNRDYSEGVAIAGKMRCRYPRR